MDSRPFLTRRESVSISKQATVGKQRGPRDCQVRVSLGEHIDSSACCGFPSITISRTVLLVTKPRSGHLKICSFLGHSSKTIIVPCKMLADDDDDDDEKFPGPF